MFSFKSVGRFAAVVIACVTVSAVGGQALAQSYTPAPNPPPVSSVDGNGVDIVSGQISLITVFDVGIGGAGSGLSRSESSFGDTFRGVMDGSPSGSMTVVFQGRSEIFNNLTPTGGSNNTLSCSGTLCTYTLADGTAAVYDTTITTASQLSGNYATLTSITKPDGEVITLRYASFQVAIVYMGVPMTITIQHPATVTSSLGWMLKNHYPGDDITKQVVKVEAINASVDYCDPTTVTCPNESQTWPYVTVNGAGGPTDMLGNYTAFNGGMAKPTSIVSPSGVTKTITYYTSGAFSGRVYQVKVGNSTWTYAYGWSGVTWTNTVTDPNGGVRTLVYDSNLSQIVSDTDPMGRKTSYTYYATNGSGAFKGAVSQVINPDATWSGSTPTGGYTQYAYDARGNVTTVTTYPKGGGTPIIVRATYAGSCSNIKTCNKPLTVTDANGITTTYAYDSASGNVASVTLPAQANGIAPQTRYTYSQITPSYYTAPGVFTAQPAVSRLTSTSTCMTGQAPACVGTTDERRTTVYYGANNASPTYRNVLPVSQTVSLGDGTLAQTSTFTYDSHGNVTSVDGPKAGTVDTVYYFYDVLNRQIGMIGPDPDNSGPRPRTASKTTYDNDGRVSEVDVGTVTGTDTNAFNAMTVVTRDTTTFDTATGVATIGRHFIGTASTPQNVTQTSYDALFRADCVAARLNPTDYASLPASACTLGTTGADGSHDRITKYAYDGDSAVLNTQSPYGTSAVRYDVSKGYDPVSGLTTAVSDAKGNVTRYYYDSFDRVVKTCYATASNGGVTNTSDCEQVTYTTGVVNGTTQSLTRPSNGIRRDGQTINFGYDNVGRFLGTSGAVSEVYSYDNFGQMLTHTNYTTGGSGAPSATEIYSYNALGWLNSDTQPAGTVSYQYDANGKRSRMTWPDGFYVTYGFDDGDELTGIFENGTAQIAGFGYDTYGRRNALTRPNGFNDGYGFDGALRLQTQALVASGVSNTITLGYNQANQITSRTNSNNTFAPPTPSVNTSTTYVADGLNRISSAGSSTLAYDTRGNMTSDGAVTYAYNANNLMTSTSNGASFVYDAENRLQSYTAGGATSKFLYDGTDLIAEYNGTTLLRRYVHGSGTDEPLVWYEGSGTAGKRYLMADERGSIVGVTDASGNVLAVNTYDAYGVPSSTNNAYAGRFRYTGQIYLPELGIYDYKARMYAPTLGRFMQTDPIGYGDGMNWYNYVGSDPMNGTDPFGLDHWLTPIDLPNGCVETRYYNQDSYNSGTAVISGNIDKNLKCPPQDPNNNHDNPWQQQPDYILGSSLGGAGEAACAALPSGRTQGVSAGLGGLGGGEAGGEEVLNYRTGATSGFGFAGAFFGWNGGASVTASTGFAWGLNDDNSNYAGGFSGASLSGPAIGGFVARSSNSFQAGTGIKGFVPAPIGTKGAVTVVGLSVGANLTGGAGGGVHFTNYTRPVQLGRFGPGWTFSDYIMYGLNQFCN